MKKSRGVESLKEMVTDASPGACLNPRFAVQSAYVGNTYLGEHVSPGSMLLQEEKVWPKKKTRQGVFLFSNPSPQSSTCGHISRAYWRYSDRAAAGETLMALLGVRSKNKEEQPGVKGSLSPTRNFRN